MLFKVNGNSRFDSDKARWLAVKRKDPTADGCFVYAVSTTGVYCRPNCAAKLAKRAHVLFFQSAKDAEHAGFRACKRCRPNSQSPRQQEAARMAKACEILERQDEEISISRLAVQTGMALPQFSHRFKAVIGVSPKQYATSQRAKRIRARLRQSSTITHAIYEAGYNSSARFYDTSQTFLGMKPSTYKRGGAGELIRYSVSKCPLGYLLVAATDKGVCSIILGDVPEPMVQDLQSQFPKANLERGGKVFSEWIKQVVRFINEPAKGLGLPLDVRGTAFQQRVWTALSKIPIGTTKSYTQIASEIGAPKSIRAVARAIASNRLALAIPCHRVIRASGDLCGFRWGVKRKQKLLESEKVKIPKT
jgi:AraC family transcriptional regulator of adaptative response/methylated-DNA-[protein]-cysteine methyltransferase